MRTITINGVSFQWKLRAKDAKALGIPGPGNQEGMTAVLAGFTNDWDAAKALVLAGVAEEKRATVEAAVDEWSFDDYPEFIKQAFGAPNRQASALVQ